MIVLLLLASIVLGTLWAVGRRWYAWIVALEEGRRAEEIRTRASRSKPATRRLSIVIPAYNEADRLPSVLDATLAYLVKRRDAEGSSFTYEVIVVDDGSSDQTSVKAWLCAKRNGAEDAVRTLVLDRNQGKGAAVRCGMLEAEGDLVLMMDADGATELAHGLEALEGALYARACRIRDAKGEHAQSNAGDGLDGTSSASQRRSAGGYGKLGTQRMAAFGSRAHLEHEEAVIRRTKIRNVAMHGFHMLVFLVIGGKIRDTQCGFKLFTRRAAFELFSQQRLQRWCFDVELAFIAQRIGIPIEEVQVKWQEKEGSKLKFLHVFNMASEMLTIFLTYNLGLWRTRTKLA